MSCSSGALIAQISDLHIKAGGKRSYRQVDTLHALHNAIQRLNQLRPRPDAVVISGDLVDFGLAEEYQTLREALSALTLPYYVMPGNHDDRQALRSAFADHAYLPTEGTLDWRIEINGLQLLALDSTLPQQSPGELRAEQLVWLDRQLTLHHRQPALVLLHHPPFLCGIEHMDRQRLNNPEALAAIIQHHPQVERVLCGHLHRSLQVRFAGTLACCAPGVSHQVALNLLPEAPAHFVLEPPGFLLHHWHPQQGMVTHQCAIADAPGPFPFYDENGLID